MDDARDLIERLLTSAAMIMEDSAEIALSRDSPLSIDARIRQTLEAGRDIEALTQAASVIHRRWVAASSQS